MPDPPADPPSCNHLDTYNSRKMYQQQQNMYQPYPPYPLYPQQMEPEQMHLQQHISQQKEHARKFMEQNKHLKSVRLL